MGGVETHGLTRLGAYLDRVDHGSIAVTREGAVPSIPYRDEVLSALAE